MEIGELRLGNLVDYECTTHIVESISKDTIGSWWFKDGVPQIELLPKDAGGVLEEAPYFDSPGSYEGIPITVDLLKKFGLKGRTDFVWNYNSFGIQIRDGKFYVAFKDLSNVLFHSIVEIKYAHQLQNIHHDLTGKELIYIHSNGEKKGDVKKKEEKKCNLSGCFFICQDRSDCKYKYISLDTN